jgi:hypothetical protein
MHPATRRWLQGEVARVYGAELPAAAPWWKRFHLGWAIALIAIFGISALTLRQSPRRVETVTGAPAPESDLKRKAEAAPAEAPVAATAAVEKKEILAGAAGATKSKLTANDEMNLFSNNINSSVLNRFELEESGAVLNFRDADGSTYGGRVIATRANAKAFTATGTNQTLQQNVVFTGEVVRAPMPVQQQAQQQNLRVVLEQVRVQGRAYVGRTNRVEIDALNSSRGN